MLHENFEVCGECVCVCVCVLVVVVVVVVRVEGREEGWYCLNSDLNLPPLDRKSSALTTPSL